MNWFKYFKIYKKDFLIETKSSQVNPTRMKRVARKKRKGGGFTRVSACHLADAQSDLLLFLRVIPPVSQSGTRNSFLQDSPSSSFNPLYRGENRIPNSLSLSLLPSLSPPPSLTIPLCIRIFASASWRMLFRIGDVTFYFVKKLKKLFPRFEIEG